MGLLTAATGSSHGVDLLDLTDPAGTPIPDRIIAFIRPLIG